MSESEPTTRSAAPSGPRGVPGPRWLDTLARISWRVLVVVGAAFALVWVLGEVKVVTLPLVIALILTTLAVPVAEALVGRGLNRTLAAAIVVFGGIAVLGGIVALLAPSFADQIEELTPTLDEARGRVLGWLETGPLGYDRQRISELVGQVTQQAQGSGGEIAAGVLSGARIIAEFVAGLFLLVIALFFFVKDGPQIVDWFIARTPTRHRAVVRAAGRRAWSALEGYVLGTATIALIDAVGIGIGLLVLGVPLVLPLAVLVFLGAFLPVIGAFIAGLVAVLVALGTGGVTSALLVLALIVGVQQLEGNVLQPVVMRRTVFLHPVVVLAALGAGAAIAGIVGAFLAVPVTAVAVAVGNELRLRSESVEAEAR